MQPIELDAICITDALHTFRLLGAVVNSLRGGGHGLLTTHLVAAKIEISHPVGRAYR